MLPADTTRRIGGVFDRAALVAMPRVMQKDYAEKLADLTPSGVPVLLVTLDYDPSEMDALLSPSHRHASMNCSGTPFAPSF